MKAIWVLSVLLAACGDLAAQQRFDTVDKLLLGTSTLAIAADWSTTIDIARRGGRENNPITVAFIGHHPSVGKVNSYMTVVALGNVVVASRLPARWRKVWLALVTARGVHATLGNYSRGLRFNFQF